MAFVIPFLLIAYAVLYAFAFSIPHIPALPTSPLRGFLAGADTGGSQKPLQDGLDSWLHWEEGVALNKLLANIQSKERIIEGVTPGSVIASPSREHPDYFYQWVRDAAITTSTLVDLYADNPFSSLSTDLAATLDEYAGLQATLQHTPNPSGVFDDLSGLGEPKFEVDGSPFIGSWGRPQRDGPALRAITLMSYVRAYNASHPTSWPGKRGDDWFSRFYEASLPADSIVKADLEYVSHFWNQSGFDLWEEVDGLHFYTSMVQLRALREGSELAQSFGDPGAADWYAQQAQYLESFTRTFWSEKKRHLVETRDSSRTGLDCGILLGSLHAYPSKYASHSPVFPPYSDEVLLSLLALVQDQRVRFPINALRFVANDEDENDDTIFGVGLGRYPEDIYDGYGNDPGRGGNPWFLCTSSAAEILYRTASHLTTTSRLSITQIGLPFYEALLSSPSLELLPGTTYGPSDAVFHFAIERLKNLGDEFLEVVKIHAGEEGSMSEQFDRETGYERGARDLTWSYGAFLQAIRARKNAMQR